MKKGVCDVQVSNDTSHGKCLTEELKSNQTGKSKVLEVIKK